MTEINVIEELIIPEETDIQSVVTPETPQVVPGEQLYVYIPIAAANKLGIASFDENAFVVENGNVAIKTSYLATLLQNNTAKILDYRTHSA